MRTLPVLLFIALALTAFVAGCMSSPAVTPPDVTSVPTTTRPIFEDQSSIAVDVLGLTPQYSVDKPFSYMARIRAVNEDTAEVTNVVIVVRLVDTKLGTVNDTKNVLIERFIPGDEKIYTVRLTGDPDRDYHVETAALFNQP